jgi:hypothetical protein
MGWEELNYIHFVYRSVKVGTSFADKRRLLGGYSLLEDYGHGVYFN